MYRYEDLKPNLFTEEGVTLYVQIRDRAKRLLAEAEAFTMGAAIRRSTGDSWLMLACVDRMVELGELREVTVGRAVTGQDRVFVKGSLA